MILEVQVTRVDASEPYHIEVTALNFAFCLQNYEPLPFHLHLTVPSRRNAKE
jgi:hypothetical protein